MTPFWEGKRYDSISGTRLAAPLGNKAMDGESDITAKRQ